MNDPANNPPSPEIRALLATIRDEWNSVESWMTHAPYMRGMPEGREYEQLTESLLAAEENSPDT